MIPKRRFAIDSDEYPFRDHWLEIDGARMHYIDEGIGTPVLLLHGNPTWSYLYRNIVKALSKEMRLIAPDYFGFGFSDHPLRFSYTPAQHAECVSALINHLGLTNIILVCQDWGGPIGLSIAAERPGDFAGLVILNTWCWPPTFDAKIFSFIMGSDLIGRYVTIKRNFFVEKIIPGGIFHKENITSALLKAYSDPFPTEASRVPVWIFPREIRRSAMWLAQVEAKLPVLRDKPIEMVWAMKDVAFGKKKILDRWRRIFANAEVEERDDAAHYLQEDRPDRIIAAIRKVLAKVHR